jgi:biopolymer transport protein ExbD
MALEARLDPTVKILVKVDKDLPYFSVAEVLDAIKLAGVNKVALAMERK